jgi:hypothetical protein
VERVEPKQCEIHDYEPVFNAEADRLVGWYCKACKHFDPAIGREKQYTMGGYSG